MLEEKLFEAFVEFIKTPAGIYYTSGIVGGIIGIGLFIRNEIN